MSTQQPWPSLTIAVCEGANANDDIDRLVPSVQVSNVLAQIWARDEALLLHCTRRLVCITQSSGAKEAARPSAALPIWHSVQAF